MWFVGSCSGKTWPAAKCIRKQLEYECADDVMTLQGTMTSGIAMGVEALGMFLDSPLSFPPPAYQGGFRKFHDFLAQNLPLTFL